MIHSILLALPIVVAAPPAEPVTPQQAKTFTLRAEQRVYDVGVNFAYQATVWFPVDCAHPAIGDPEYFAVYFNPNLTGQRRFVISAQIDKLGATTNVTFSCNEGVRAVLKVTQVPAAQAALSVEFVLDRSESERVRAAVEAQREVCQREKDDDLANARIRFLEDAERLLAEGLILRLVYGDEFTATKQDFINVKSRNAVLIGGRGYILFEVQPRDDEPVVIQRVEVLAAESEAILPETRLVMPERNVVPGAVGKGVAIFDNPADTREFTLVVHREGGDPIHLKGIEL